ncbi:PIN domain-containing protein [Anaerovibrio sp. JC8]|uniref:PIN domain-containing protein n=1 Tax=Anaerovibrio sp. JC8 TaxID=1240085 RepID=UPI000A109DE2|nr:PIN domain-containing protein [Anaerovibrio sp. JC8]
MKSIRVLIDTNIVLDWLMQREPFNSEAKTILYACLHGKIRGYLTAHCLTDLFYILRKDMEVTKRKQVLLLLCRYFYIITEDYKTIKDTLENQAWLDLEDGLQMQCAFNEKLDFIITRNIKDFETSKVPACLPNEFIEGHLV